MIKIQHFHLVRKWDDEEKNQWQTEQKENVVAVKGNTTKCGIIISVPFFTWHFIIFVPRQERGFWQNFHPWNFSTMNPPKSYHFVRLKFLKKYFTLLEITSFCRKQFPFCRIWRSCATENASNLVELRNGWKIVCCLTNN